MQDTIIELNYKSFGQGEPVIILHGLFGMLDNWVSFAKDLASEYQVFIVDLRNHGRSTHSTAMNYELMVADLLHFMDDHRIYKAYILGHSMGGKLAMEFAREHEDRIMKLMVVDIAPKKYDGNHHHILNALSQLDLNRFSTRKEIEDLLIPSIPSFAIRRFLMKNLKRKRSGGFEFKMNLPVLKANYARILEKTMFSEPIQTETMFVRGDLSPYVTDEDWDYIQNWFPRSNMRTIEAAGHWVHADQPNELLMATKHFFGL